MASITYPKPEFIYEGFDSSKFEEATGIVTNRAPKQIHQNVLDILTSLNDNFDPRLSVVENLLKLYKGSEVFSIGNTYSEYNVVNDGNGTLYISLTNKNIGYPLTDTLHWKKISYGINDTIISEDTTWSSSRLREYLINNAYDPTTITIDGLSAAVTGNLIKLRRDKSDNWTESNPILSAGEIGIETDSTGDTKVPRFKIGNGVSSWNDLTYVADREYIEPYVQKYVKDYVSTWSTNTGGYQEWTRTQLSDLESKVVHKTGDETIAGNKTFSGVATFNQVIQGTALKAKYADLAEYYESDKNYPAGTLIKFGGDKEITQASLNCVNGVISTNPGYFLNAHENLNGFLPVALVGRVPVRIIGPVNKGDKIVSSGDGTGIVNNLSDRPIAIALQSNSSPSEVIVECVTKFIL